jgi:hypothetical protein
VLTPNTILWGQNVHTIDESDTDDGEEVVKLSSIERPVLAHFEIADVSNFKSKMAALRATITMLTPSINQFVDTTADRNPRWLLLIG